MRSSIEDKIVQRAVVEILNCVYEQKFLGFSYAFRPGRNQHDALDALWVGIRATAVNWIVDADIRSFFDTVNHDWLIRFVEHRIGDQRMIRLIRKWLKAGVLEGTILTSSETGTPQGAVVSPLLANIYLHYCFDLWVQQWRKRNAQGKMIVVRYAVDLVAGFEHESEAGAFLGELRTRFEACGDRRRRDLVTLARCRHFGPRVIPRNLGAHFQRLGGLARTAAKVAAARENGRKGGRPRLPRPADAPR